MKQKVQHQKCIRATKTLGFFLCLFFPIGLLCSCTNSDETVVNRDTQEINKRAMVAQVQKATVSEDVAAFFSSELPPIGLTHGEEQFFTTLGALSDTCCIVNSRSELQSLYAGSKPLPEIDFENNSLIIGKVMLTGGSEIVDFDVDMKDDAFIVNLAVNKHKEAALTAFFPYYYWGLFEKLPNKEISVKTNINNE